MADDRLAKVLAGNLERNSPFAKPGPYQTFLGPRQETAFRGWVNQNKVPFKPQQSAQDYDMRGFWSALQSGDPRAQSAVDPHDQRLHYPDVWKTPHHQTFSSDSQWAQPNAPRWLGDRLVAASGRILFDPTSRR